MSRLDGVRFDEVGIYNVEKHNVIVTSVGCDRKMSGLVSEYLTFRLGDSHETYWFCRDFWLVRVFPWCLVMMRGFGM